MNLSFIDLFCGCGGFTLGMERAGFQCLAAIDFNTQAVATLRANLPHIKHAIQRDLTGFPPDEFADLIGTRHVGFIKVSGGPRKVRMPKRDFHRLMFRSEEV